jgi:hypothetical protein
MSERLIKEIIKVPNIPIDFSDHLVAFVDFLGFRKRIEQTSDENVPALISKINRVFYVFSYRWEKNPYDTFKSNSSLEFKFFTDCACIATPSRERGLEIMIEELAWLQLTFSKIGIFLRGGIAEGKHFHNNWMIFSKAEVKAYDLEQSTCYPRIEIERSLVTEKKWPSDIFLFMENEGVYFIDYLENVRNWDLEDDQLIKQFVNHKKKILAELETHSDPDDYYVRQKYDWLSQYHNFKVK